MGVSRGALAGVCAAQIFTEKMPLTKCFRLSITMSEWSKRMPLLKTLLNQESSLKKQARRILLGVQKRVFCSRDVLIGLGP